jgi:hypothetical protein
MGRIGFLVLLSGAVISCATSTVPFDEDAGIDPIMDAASCATKCDGGCSDLKTDNANCGKCGNACPPTAMCVQGSCQCAAGDRCGNMCVDFKTDNTNCGKCGTICGLDAGAVMGGGTWGCLNGNCSIICPAPKVECNGACVDVKTDNDNCGMCGTTCVSMTEQCTDGLCCAMGSKVCNAMCTNTMSDANNCGMCGNKCPNNMPSCSMGTCTTSMIVQIFPPNGTLNDPGNPSVWGGRYYTMTFPQQRNILAIEWRANLSSNDTIRGGVWNPQNMAKLATGNPVNGNNMQAFYRSTISFTALANTPYLIGIFMSNPNTVFPRKDGPSYPFTMNGITVTNCRSTSGTTDIFPTASNSWGPDFRLEIQ